MRSLAPLLLAVFLSSSAAAQSARVCAPPVTAHQTVEDEQVSDELGALLPYFDHYPCERINGKNMYDIIRSAFISIAGEKAWQRLLTITTESPMTVQSVRDQALVGSYLVLSLCKARACDKEQAMILVTDEDRGPAGRKIRLAGICFVRSSGRSEVDLYTEGVSVRALKKMSPRIECSPELIFSVTGQFYAPE